MLGSRRNGDGSSVTCIGCGTELDREDAREYDKHGDRWNRAEKEFEYLCKGCHRELCHQPRDGLESLLVESQAGELSRDDFLQQFLSRMEETQESADGTEP